MHKRRCLSWNAALRDIRSDRVRVSSGIISARSLIQGLVRIRRTSLITQAGAFDRTAIMSAAIEAARAHRLRTGAIWSASMSVGLAAAWQAAKTERLSTFPRTPSPAEHDRGGRCFVSPPPRPKSDDRPVASNRAHPPGLQAHASLALQASGFPGAALSQGLVPG